MFSVWGHSTYEKNDDKELMQPQEQPIRRTAAQEKRKKICMYCIKINRERRHWKSYAHKPGHVQNDSGSKKQKKKKKPPRPQKVGSGEKEKGKGKATAEAPKVIPDTCGGKILFKVNQQSRKVGERVRAELQLNPMANARNLFVSADQKQKQSKARCTQKLACWKFKLTRS